jgi:hypothetical protein
MAPAFASLLPESSFQQPTTQGVMIEQITIQRQLLHRQRGTKICIALLITLQDRRSELCFVRPVGRTSSSLMHQTVIA